MVKVWLILILFKGAPAPTYNPIFSKVRTEAQCKDLGDYAVKSGYAESYQCIEVIEVNS